MTTDPLVEAARAETARIYGQVMSDHKGPAPESVITELVDAICPPIDRRSLVSATRIEQMIARGWGDQRIASDLHTSREVVSHVRAAMDKAAS